ncbi:hypothetical protein HYP18_gp05 [Xuanwuvirus P884B11]|uniref:Uncharacterized protein n=1 Tax=Xuanwuvirus P884B11 TaxID=2844224 RepID=A0A653FSL2_9CAUD|nr:hypothetical protein HYP18_gp05 [Xuanwuvirus P884B11]VUD40166.1 hypothetical protein [Xuanwuvirus P884B11]
MLQPSHVNVLKQLVGAEVGLICVRRAVETDHDAVKRHLPGNLCADAGLKIRVCRPGIKLRIRNKRVVVHLFALVFAVFQINHVIRVTAFCAVITGIRARNRPGGVQEDFFAFLVGHTEHVNFFCKFSALLYCVFKTLLHRGFHGKSRYQCRYRDVVKRRLLRHIATQLVAGNI